jgi:hypothetical protein
VSWGRHLTNFDGLEGLQALCEATTLRVSAPSKEPQTVEGGQRLVVGDDEYPLTTITLHLPWEDDLVLHACNEARLAVDDVSMVVGAEDPTLKERERLRSFNLGAREQSYRLADGSSGRPRALGNRRGGCTIWVHLVLNKAMDPEPGRPHRLGTKLASSSFALRADGAGLGFDPKPLEAATAQRLGIPSSTLIFLELKDDLATSHSLDGAIEVYIKESIFELLARDQLSKESQTIAEGLAHDAAKQLVYLTSRSLQDGSADPEAAAITMIHGWMKEAKLDRKLDDAIEMITSRPEVVAGWLSSGSVASSLEWLLKEFAVRGDA